MCVAKIRFGYTTMTVNKSLQELITVINSPCDRDGCFTVRHIVAITSWQGRQPICLTGDMLQLQEGIHTTVTSAPFFNSSALTQRCSQNTDRLD